MSLYSGKSKIELCKRLGDDWQDLADSFDIPPEKIKKFRQGRECQEIWEWLESRNKLEELPESLKYIGREDLVQVLEQNPNANNFGCCNHSNLDLRIAIHWIIRLLYEDELDYVELDKVSLSEPNKPFFDVVIFYKNGSKQALETATSNTRDDLDKLNLDTLEREVPHAKFALSVLKSLVENHRTGLKASKLRLTRDDVISEFDKHGIVRMSQIKEAEILKSFNEASQIGRQDVSREIAGEKIFRVELNQIIEFLENGEKTILLTDSPGSGKTWLLLELADIMEQNDQWGVLFIKGDHFAHIDSEASLYNEGLPNDIVGLVSRLSTYKKVVVIIDSLDVLSLNRDHRALKVFLSLLDRLEKVPNVLIVAACRNFDLSYDPLLRDRKWSQKISVPNLDFESSVSPILKKLGIDPTSVQKEQQKLLSVPQNLKLFERIGNKVPLNSLTSSYQLYDVFLEEVIVKDDYLGNKAMSAIENMAAKLVKARKLSMPKASFSGNEDIYRRLVSSEILQNRTDLAFSHQTLLDILVTRKSIKKGETLKKFILRHPPMPFIRPSVRTFLFYLRIHDPQSFSQQVKKVLKNQKIAYHLKRLIAESLAEIQPETKDIPLFQSLLREHTELFRRFFWKIKGEAWFELFYENLFEILLNSDDEKLRIELISKLREWMNTKPSEVIFLWQEALKIDEKIGNEILFILNEFKRWKVVEIYALIKSLIMISDESRYLGKAISRYIEKTGKGEKLLWKYIIADVYENQEIKNSLHIKKNLRCDSYTFHNKEFLNKIFCHNDTLLTLAFESLDNWSYQDRFSLELGYTSWRYKHEQKDFYTNNSLTEFFKALECALNTRSRNYKKWWQKNEPTIRQTQDIAITYLLIQAYCQNIEQNIIAIAAFLNREDILQETRLAYEIGEMIRKAYPYLSECFQEKLQLKILCLSYQCEESKEEPKWVICEKYRLLCYIPSFFRLLNVQNFIETWEHEFGVFPQPPYIYSRGGIVSSPISVEQIMSLSDKALLNLLKCYDEDFSSPEFLIGGTDSVVSTFRECCTLSPERFFLFIEKIYEENIYKKYAIAIMKGIADHLRYQFGNLSP